MGQLSLRVSSKTSVRATVSNRPELRLALLLAVCLFLSGCSTAEKPKAEAVPSPVVLTDQPQQASNLPPPELSMVQEAVKRVFKDSAVIDTSRKPAFISGDFNGDLSQDIAVVLKPAPEKLSELNEEFATWIVRDPFATNESRIPRLRVAADDVLLGVIHGYGPNGWQDPQATQTYLLKNAVGSGMEAHHAKDVVAANQSKKRPRLNGDVIGQVIGGTPGYLYYVGASYSWYDPKTFKGDPEPGMFHGVARRRVKQ
ncbi:MAG TPA: hypothetical protein VIF64_03350 [Pyrinomonadaceae bacterium]|jgi:hypothetical protein